MFDIGVDRAWKASRYNVRGSASVGSVQVSVAQSTASHTDGRIDGPRKRSQLSVCALRRKLALGPS